MFHKRRVIVNCSSCQMLLLAMCLTSLSLLQSQLSPCGRCGLQVEGKMIKLPAAISLTSVSVLQSQLSPCGRCWLQVDGKMIKLQAALSLTSVSVLQSQLSMCGSCDCRCRENCCQLLLVWPLYLCCRASCPPVGGVGCRWRARC